MDSCWIRVYSLIAEMFPEATSSLTVKSEVNVSLYRTEDAARHASTEFGGVVFEVSSRSLASFLLNTELLFASEPVSERELDSGDWGRPQETAPYVCACVTSQQDADWAEQLHSLVAAVAPDSL